jgi:DNA polymerase-3 subunit beta
MKISVNNLDLTNALKETSLNTGKHENAILDNVLVKANKETITFVSTDLKETQISFEIPATFENGFNFAVLGLLPVKEVIGICKASELNETLSLNFKSYEKIIIESKDMTCTIPVFNNISDFPDLITGTIKAPSVYNELIDIDSKILLEKLENIAYSMAKKDMRFYLNGLLLELEENRLNFIATDGHRLSFDSIELDQSYAKKQVILPNTAVKSLIKALKTHKTGYKQIQFLDNAIHLYAENANFFIKAIEGKYPDYKRVLPVNKFLTLDIDRKAMIKLLKKIEPFSNDKYKGVSLVRNENSKQLTVKTNNPSRMETEIKLDIFADNAEKFEIGFNLVYLKDALNKLKNDTVSFCLSGINSSATIKESANDSFVNVVMPMRRPS